MNTTNKLLKSIILGLLTGLSVSLAHADTTDGTAVATVIAPLSISENIGMDFGTISGGPASGTVLLDTAGSTDSDGDAETISGGSEAAGDFTISGESGQAYSLTYTSGTLGDGGTETMSVDTFTDNSVGVLPAATETFQVGATLNLGADQVAGNYSTSAGNGSPYTVTVNYN